jgi:DNA-binding CsgD family transcriptional regulator
MSRTLEALKHQPGITPAELASILSVSPSYARTLLRRARARKPEPVQSLRSAPQDFERTVHELSARLTETENHLAALKAVPLHSRTSMHLNRRAEVLRLAEAGESESAIAGSMGIPPGEVAFILKVDRLLASAVQSR